jgi:DNA-directed RNA polymerase subunit K/omega
MEGWSMNSQWLDLYQQSGWNIDKVIGNAPHYSEPLNSILSQMVEVSTTNRLPLVIPRVDDEKQLHFYLIGKDEQQLEEVFGSIKAYVGGSYTTCFPMTYRAGQDQFEQRILEIFPQGFRHITIQKSCSRQDDKTDTYWVMDSLNMALQQYHQRPVSITTIKRPIGLILRHFFIAIQKQKGEKALQLLLELKNHKRLSPRNILSLEVQALAADEKWRSILNHPKLEDLVKGTIPRRLQNVLLKCISFDHSYSTTPNNYNREELYDKVQPLFPLFSTTPDLENNESSITEWQLWGIGAAAFGRTVAIEQLPSCVPQEWIDELKKWSGIKPESIERDTTSTHSPQLSIEDYLTFEPSPESAAKLLHESAVANYNFASQIYERLCQYPASIIDKVSTDNSWMSQYWAKLKQDYGTHLEINSWHQLFQKLGKNCTLEEANSALTFTVDRSEYWPSDTWHAERVMGEISDISDDITRSTLRDLLPLLLGWLEKNAQQLSSEAIEHFMILLVEDDQIASEDLNLCNDLLVLLVDQPHTKEQYNSLLDCIEICWNKVKSPHAVEALLDLQETLIDSPCSDENRRLQSWLEIQPFLIHTWSRLDNQEQILIHGISQVISSDTSSLPPVEPVDFSGEGVEVVDLSGKLLAIYTLTEGAGRRAKEILSEYFPGLTVKLNHDKSATDALMNLATTADFFIFSSRSAAHQAFYPVSNKRSDLIYPKGKGTSSIIREFLEYVSY